MTLKRILKSFTKTIKQLENFIAYEDNERIIKSKNIERLKTEVNMHDIDIERASNIIKKLNAIIE